MKMKLWKRLLARLLAVALCLCALLVPAAALEMLDADRTGSISVTIRDGGKTVSGGTMTLYQVAQYHQGRFQPTLLFVDSGFDQEALGADMASDLADFALEQGLVGVTKTIDGQGTLSFAELPLGVFLLVQQEAAPGYRTLAPFLVTVPMESDGGYLYDVDASPKVDPSPVAPPGPSGGPTPTSTPTPTPTPSTTPEPTPDHSPEPSPSGSPEPSPEESPEPSPGETTSPAPSDSPQVTPPTDTTGSRLPNTGQLKWPIPVLAILGMVFFGLGWYLRQKHRES